MSCTVTIESRDPETGEVQRDVFELTPAPSPGDERRVLVELVTGIHPNAVEVSWGDGVVVLDEASSRLDPATEHRLEQAVDRLLAGRTGLVIAHRLRTLQRADDVLILDSGRVVEYGPRAVLAADPRSRFHALLQSGLEAALV